ncbi:hypothetical protein [Inmirania thermothiophila]|uniref:HAMP domain-containing protein n=1 Tax=Inmirania thermothiophila TaxID=1750597 RepID=A0A3N1Y6P9_9GAMM|nr:hypothetical protein [Inmirania thermothiophila]ROR34509.1 hypothetical protein EDC57_0407 [Inmirania thermothiophila]
MTREGAARDLIRFALAALVAGTVVLAFLAAAVWLAAAGTAGGYETLVRGALALRRGLDLALLLAAGLALGLGALAAGAAALYASFRVVGPLYRIARNFERLLEAGPVPPVPVRRGDRLRREARLLERASAALEGHAAAVAEEARRAREALARGEDAGPRIEALRELVRRVEV